MVLVTFPISDRFVFGTWDTEMNQLGMEPYPHCVYVVRGLLAVTTVVDITNKKIRFPTLGVREVILRIGNSIFKYPEAREN